MEQLTNWYSGLDQRDQKITLVAGVFVFLFLLYMLIIEPINSTVDQLQREVAATETTIARIKQQVPIVLASKRSGGGNISGLPLTSVVNSTTTKYNLPVSRRDSKSPNEMQVWFDNVSFDSFLQWVAEINKQHGVTVTSVNVRGQDRNGVTSINVKLLK
jgi:general secretion pathway protein M